MKHIHPNGTKYIFPYANAIQNNVIYPNILQYIFPVAQVSVQNILSAIHNDPNLKNNKLYIFGSALTVNFGIGSDLDIAVDCPEETYPAVFRTIKENINIDYDIIHLQTLSNSILKEKILKDGFCIYG